MVEIEEVKRPDFLELAEFLQIDQKDLNKDVMQALKNNNLMHPLKSNTNYQIN
jgi:hypothetical protein